MDTDRWEDPLRRFRARAGTSGLLVGAVVIGIGLFLLLDNLEIVQFHDVWRFWPVLLIVWGASRILESVTPSGYIWGGIVTLIGAFLLLDNLEIFRFDIFLLWPLVIIAIGVNMLVRTLERKRVIDGVGPPGMTSSRASLVGDPNFNAWVLFSGVKRKIDSHDFK